jgi:hypothetical protein
MKSWVLACLFLKNYISRDMIRLLLIHLHPFKFQTWWLRNERCNMMREYSKMSNNLFIELVENTTGAKSNIGCIPSFLDQYRHESGSYYTDTYDCSFYLEKDNKICDCGECGGTSYAIWCEYKKYEKIWNFELHMDNYGKHLSPMKISNLYFQEFSHYHERIKKKRIALSKQLPIKIFKRFEKNEI